MQQPIVNRFLLISAMTVAFGSLAFGHIRIAPTESTAGAREKYTMRSASTLKKPRSSFRSSSNIMMTERKKSLRVQWGPGCHLLWSR